MSAAILDADQMSGLELLKTELVFVEDSTLEFVGGGAITNTL